MTRLAKLLAPLCAALLVGGCGGSSHSGTSAASPASSTTSTPATVAVPSSTTTSASSATSAASRSAAPSSKTTGTTSTTTATPRHDGGTTAGSSGSRGGSGSGSGGRATRFARLPATFTITPGGMLAPTAVSLPAVASVVLSIRSEDARIRHVILRMPSRAATLTVPPHGRASAVLHGIKPGRYVVDVDGLARGLVLVGGIPGSR